MQSFDKVYTKNTKNGAVNSLLLSYTALVSKKSDTAINMHMRLTKVSKTVMYLYTRKGKVTQLNSGIFRLKHA